MVGHPALVPKTTAKTVALFGQPFSRRSDGIHLWGSGGARQHTDSVLRALKTAGLALPAAWHPRAAEGSPQSSLPAVTVR